ncbi:hypothetical protein CC1G_14859 [Coprinopsis cinerea okayama7|uniref:Uncharacterized protein n=1 Tax=Coprinopsis cinerea (strain Okayama-7 / 130 / ATCC MYA-4618 / FGSC 9003) TaxID=240176 RepID=D6RNW4_COPC7|nr:hypothetical protein CC1G_14859 [Coprinopsis cinerea okayama7\|eukprot:XP_002910882.1 hypothetical protein CC1G_14859 [Coprinopsis cinerea okayama7\
MFASIVEHANVTGVLLRCQNIEIDQANEYADSFKMVLRWTLSTFRADRFNACVEEQDIQVHVTVTDKNGYMYSGEE